MGRFLFFFSPPWSGLFCGEKKKDINTSEKETVSVKNEVFSRPDILCFWATFPALSGAEAVLVTLSTDRKNTQIRQNQDLP